MRKRRRGRREKKHVLPYIPSNNCLADLVVVISPHSFLPFFFVHFFFFRLWFPFVIINLDNTKKILLKNAAAAAVDIIDSSDISLNAFMRNDTANNHLANYQAQQQQREHEQQFYLLYPLLDDDGNMEGQNATFWWWWWHELHGNSDDEAAAAAIAPHNHQHCSPPRLLHLSLWCVLLCCLSTHMFISILSFPCFVHF